MIMAILLWRCHLGREPRLKREHVKRPPINIYGRPVEVKHWIDVSLGTCWP